jgi:hypothetical protein
MHERMGLDVNASDGIVYNKLLLERILTHFEGFNCAISEVSLKFSLSDI